MGGVAAELLPWAQAALVAMFSLLALAAVVRAPRSGPPGWWVAATFGSLAVALVAGQIADSLGKDLPEWLAELRIVLILTFPYLLLRFTASFRDLPRWLEVAAAIGAAGLALMTLVIPATNAGQWRWATAYLLGVLFYWVLLSLATIVRLWRAGHGQPTVARRRMRLMSVATAVLALALLTLVLGALVNDWPLLQ